MGAVLVKNADRMMTSANALQEGIELTFADGCRGLVPFADIPEVKGLADIVSIELPNPYELVLRNSQSETFDFPWDFASHYCDPAYRPRVEAVRAMGRQTLGRRMRQLRESARMTQAELAAAAGIGRVTMVRIESGEQAPRYETLVALAAAIGRPVGDLIAGEAVG